MVEKLKKIIAEHEAQYRALLEAGYNKYAYREECMVKGIIEALITLGYEVYTVNGETVIEEARR